MWRPRLGAAIAAVAVLTRAIALSPQSNYTHFALGYSELLRADHEVSHGQPATSALDRAQASLETSIRLNPGNAFCACAGANAPATARANNRIRLRIDSGSSGLEWSGDHARARRNAW